MRIDKSLFFSRLAPFYIVVAFALLGLFAVALAPQLGGAFRRARAKSQAAALLQEFSGACVPEQPAGLEPQEKGRRA